MEKPLDKCLDEIMSVQGVTGVLCTDHNGLCLNSKGKVSKNASGFIAELTQLASGIEPETRKPPTIILESDTTNIYVKSVGNVTTAIYKTSK